MSLEDALYQGCDVVEYAKLAIKEVEELKDPAEQRRRYYIALKALTWATSMGIYLKKDLQKATEILLGLKE